MAGHITDVAGVRVGHVAARAGAGVTVVMPPAETGMYAWGSHIVGDPGVVTGLAVLEDFAFMGSPIWITSLLCAGRIYNGALTHAFGLDAGLPVGAGWPPIVIGVEDGSRERLVTEEDAVEAVRAAGATGVERGRVGAGTGAVSYGMGAGIGSASVRLSDACTVGVLTLARHGRREDLVIRGERKRGALEAIAVRDSAAPCAVSILATDAPLAPHRLDALCRSVARGWADMGWTYRDSGVAIGFATGEASGAPAGIERAAREAAAESVLDALLHGEEELSSALDQS